MWLNFREPYLEWSNSQWVEDVRLTEFWQSFYELVLAIKKRDLLSWTEKNKNNPFWLTINQSDMFFVFLNNIITTYKKQPFWNSFFCERSWFTVCVESNNDTYSALLTDNKENYDNSIYLRVKSWNDQLFTIDINSELIINELFFEENWSKIILLKGTALSFTNIDMNDFISSSSDYYVETGFKRALDELYSICNRYNLIRKIWKINLDNITYLENIDSCKKIMWQFQSKLALFTRLKWKTVFLNLESGWFVVKDGQLIGFCFDIPFLQCYIWINSVGSIVINLKYSSYSVNNNIEMSFSCDWSICKWIITSRLVWRNKIENEWKWKSTFRELEF